MCLETEPCLHRDSSHAAGGNHFTERKRIDRRVDPRIVHVIENVISSDTKIKYARVFDRDGAIKRHVKRNASWPFDDVAAGVAKAAAAGICAVDPRSAEGGCIEPFLRGRIG